MNNDNGSQGTKPSTVDDYRKFLAVLDRFAVDGNTDRLGGLLDRGFSILTHTSGFDPKQAYLPTTSSYTKEISENLKKYVFFNKQRIKRHIGDSLREITSERHAYHELSYVSELIERLAIPTRLDSRSAFINRLVNEAYNLSLAQVSTAVDVSDDGYIRDSDVYSTKIKSTVLAQAACRMKERFRTIGNSSPRFDSAYFEFRKAFSDTDPQATREFEFVATQPKRLSHQEKDINSVIQQLENLPEKYLPDVIIPVAHGGIELGTRLDVHYTDKGHSPICYPLLFSVKTRRHSSPRTFPDRVFLSELEDKKIVVTEDWISTGKTLVGLLGDITSMQPQDVKVASVKQDPASRNNKMLSNYPVYAGEMASYKGGN